MDSNTKLEIFGTEELVQLFDELTKANQDKIIKSGFRKSGTIILKEAKSNLAAGKKHTEFKRIEKSFRIEDVKAESEINGVNIGNTSYLSRWLESGTKERYTKARKTFLKSTTKKPTGKIMGIHFLEKATETKGEAALNELFNNIKLAFELLIKKYSK